MGANRVGSNPDRNKQKGIFVLSLNYQSIQSKLSFLKKTAHQKRENFIKPPQRQLTRHKGSHTLAARISPDEWRFPSRCDGQVVKALDLKSNGSFPRRFEPFSQRKRRDFCSVVKSQLSASFFKQN